MELSQNCWVFYSNKISRNKQKIFRYCNGVFPIFTVLNHHRISRDTFFLLQSTRKANIKYLRTNRERAVSSIKASRHSMCEKRRENQEIIQERHEKSFSRIRRTEVEWEISFPVGRIFSFLCSYTLKRTRRGLRKYGMQIFDRSALRCGNGVWDGRRHKRRETRMERSKRRRLVRQLSGYFASLASR